jgi:hypothetical protein
MIFTTTQRYHSSLSEEDFINRMTGRHLLIHNLDFEVLEKDHSLSIIPHAEEEQAIKTLPITHVDVKMNGNETKVVITSKMRKIDSGGPLLILTFCAFLFIAAIAFLYVGRERQYTYTFLGIGLSIFIVFYVRMQMGYFDYVRKIRTFIKSKLDLNGSMA